MSKTDLSPPTPERFAVRLVINIDVESERMPSGDAVGMAQACAEVVAAQALVQGTKGRARTLPGKMTVARRRKAKKGSAKARSGS